MSQEPRAIIIGNGIAGITAARKLRELQPEWAITVLSGESTHHYSRPALMYIFMGHMRYHDTKPYEDWVWKRERIDLVRDWVVDIDTDAQQLTLHKGEPIHYDKLLLATGSKSNRFGWPGQDLEGVQGLYDLMDLRQLYETAKTTRHAAIVGGGLIGIELAEMLHSRGIHVTILVREDSYWSNVLPPEESQMVSRLIERTAGIDLRLETELKEIIGDEHGRACAVLTNDDERIDVQMVGLTAGVSPNLDLVKDTKIETGRGVLVDWSLRTSVEHVYAAGDCAEIVQDGDKRNLIQQVWYTGKMQGEVAARAMAGEDDVKYDPGIWYNSAKFLDIEYQTYGFVYPQPQDGQTYLWWEHPDGMKGLRLVVDDAGTFLAMNIMGMRYRHEVCERWIAEQRPIEYVLDHLAEANFDTEFFVRHEDDIVHAMRAQLTEREGVAL